MGSIIDRLLGRKKKKTKRKTGSVRISFDAHAAAPVEVENTVNAFGVKVWGRKFTPTPADKPMPCSFLVSRRQANWAASLISGESQFVLTGPPEYTGIKGVKPKTRWSKKPQRKWTFDTIIVQSIASMFGVKGVDIPVKGRGKKSKLWKALTW